MGQIQKILIVGGGSSGWMAAALLRERLPPTVQITLVEASDIPIIGVGESTNVVCRHFHAMLGLDQKAFMRASNAAFKNSIHFENFNYLGGTYSHPFGEASDSMDPLFKPRAERSYSTFHTQKLGNAFSPELSHAYQIDAGLYAQYLKTIYRPKGVQHVVDRIQGVDLAPNGDIARIHTDRSGPLVADLYLDCTGFRSLLLDKTMHEPFHSSTKYLINDRAVAARVPYIDKARELKTYTNCTALGAGWVWNIPLWSRIGTGYVYSSAFRTPAEAEKEYREFLGVERVKDLQFNHIEIRTGRHERAWVGNCVGIGISFGFLEPLESTGLSLTQIAIVELAVALSSGFASGIGRLGSRLPTKDELPTLTSCYATAVERDMFNRRQAQLFDATRDFVMAHFVLTKRDDTPYWRHIRYENPLPDSLLNVLQYARQGRYDPLDAIANPFYGSARWNIILSGMGFFDSPKFDQSVRPNESPPLPKTYVLADYLKEHIYDDAEYKDPTPQNTEQLRDLHPIWKQTW